MITGEAHDNGTVSVDGMYHEWQSSRSSVETANHRGAKGNRVLAKIENQT